MLIALVASALAIGTGWAGWVSLQLIEILATLRGNAERLDDHERRIGALEAHNRRPRKDRQ